MAARGRGDGGGRRGTLKTFAKAYYQVALLRLLRYEGWLGIYFSSVSEFHVEGNEIRGNMTEICTIFNFNHVGKTCFAYNFFWCIF